jgi:tetratricopeptide (TPR) repeat protein
MMDENLRVQDSERHEELHDKAAVYFEKRLEKAMDEDVERWGLERLYHRVRENEIAGIKLFQQMAEELVQYRLTNRLSTLLNDVNTYPLEHDNCKSWREYYNARLLFLLVRFWDSIILYEKIGYNTKSESKLRAYALCDLADLLTQREISHQPGVLEKSLKASQKSLEVAPELDAKTILNYRTQSDIYFIQFGDWEKAFSYLNTVQDFYGKSGDKYGEASAYRAIKTLNALHGNWSGMYIAQKRGLDILPKEFGHSTVYAELISSWSPAYAWSGRYNEAESNTREAMKIANKLGEVDLRGLVRDLGLILAVQGKFKESDEYFQEWDKLRVSLNLSDIERATVLRWQSVSWIKEGKLQEAEKALTDIVATLQTASYTPSMGEVLTWLGLAYELDIEYEKSIVQYQHSLNHRGRQYFECGALTGLVRVKHAQGDITAILPLFVEAERLAQQYEYNDHLASLRLTQGHLTWESGKQDEALAFFQHAMTYALRYNRFLLDELLSGRPQGTPLRPVIPYCLERGEDGKKILLALRDWWKTGVNDVGTPRPDTISPIPEGLPLLEAEKLTRQREPGDGSMQKSVVEQIESVL